MSSTIAIPRGIETVNNSPEVSRYYGINNLPYSNTAQVLSEIEQAKRYEGQTVNVNKVEWWFKDGISDVDLVIKITGSGGGDSPETLITTGGNKNNEPTPTKVLRFSNMVTPTILSGLANPVDGKRVICINNTLQNIPILHESGSSLEANRLSNTNNQDLFVVVGGACEYIYISSLSRWILINIWATDYFASLVGIGKRAVAVTAQGMAVAEAIVDLKVWDTARTTAYTKSTINTAYSTLTKGQQVVCPNITGGGLTYEKYDDSTNDWIIISTPKLT